MQWHRSTTGRSSGTRLADAAAIRLYALSRQWRPAPQSDAPPVPRVVSCSPSDQASVWQSLRDESEPDHNPDLERRLHLGPWSASALRGLAVLVAVALTFAGWWIWSGRPRAVAVAPTVLSVGVPIADAGPSAAPLSTGPVIVHVTGLVAHPGLVELVTGARVADAIAAAGGVTRTRAADSVNLARVLTDGEQLVVSLASPTPQQAPGSTAALVDLNLAAPAQLEALPGVGPVIAARIVAWRGASGPFRSVEELAEVAGIGDSILEQVRALVRV